MRWRKKSARRLSVLFIGAGSASWQGGAKEGEDRKEEWKGSRRILMADSVDDCQSIRAPASQEYRGWLPGLLGEQLYLSSSAGQKPADRVVARTTDGKHRDDGGLGPRGERKTLGYRSSGARGGVAPSMKKI
ncbi:hypothetical protein KM043_002655 [Ampulex compressa]|nr:hypothetical protein KM043_002655 [Ampulex compressa]